MLWACASRGVAARGGSREALCVWRCAGLASSVATGAGCGECYVARRVPMQIFLTSNSLKQCLLACFFCGLSSDVSLQDLIVALLTSIIIHDINFLAKEGIRRKLIKTETRSDFSN